MQLQTPRRQAAASAAARSSSNSWHERRPWPPLLQLLLLWCSAAALLAGRCHAAEEATPTMRLTACDGKPSCATLTTDGTVATMPPLFLQAITNSSVDEIVVAGDRYVLRPSAWAHLSQQAPYVITRNITVRGASATSWSVIDFSLIEKKLLIARGVSVKFERLVLQNIRKLGGFGLDIFMGDAGSLLVLRDVMRVKLACQASQDVVASARSFKRVSPAFPPNMVTLVPRVCFSAAIRGAGRELNCFDDAIGFPAFSTVMANNEPDKGSQSPGYVLYQINTTRVCQNFIAKQCLQDHNDDEELCMAMLIAAVGGVGGAPAMREGPGGGSSSFWTPGAVVGVALAGAVFLLAVLLLVTLRHKLRRCCRHPGAKDADWDDAELGGMPPGAGLDSLVGGEAYGSLCSTSGTATSRAISQQVTLGVLLGAGSFGRVYRGRWHSTDVAIKIINVRSPDELPKVLREAEVMMQLSHHNIVRAFHVSVWNPTEQLRALQAREARTSTDARTRPGAGVARQVADARRNSRRLSQSSVLAHAAACEGSSAASLHHTSGQQVITPLISEQQPAPAGAGPQQPLQQPQHATASTNVTTSGSLLAVVSPATLDCTTASSNSAAAACGSVDGTGWLQLVPLRGGSNSSGSQRQRQPQQQAGTPAAASSRAATVDCAAVDLAAAGSSGNNAAQREQAARLASSDGAADAPRSQHGAAARVLRAFGSAGPLHSGSPRHQQQQQQHLHDLGGLRRHLLGSWRGSRRKSSDELHASGNSSILLPPPAQATTGAAGGSAAGSSRPADEISSGAIASGGPEATAQQPQQKQPGLARHTHNASQGRLSGDSDHSHNEGDQSREARPPAEAQVWIILELCAGGTLMDAVLSGRLHTEGRVDLPKLLSRLLEAAQGMAYLHGKGVMHGDLKASNVLLDNSIHGSYGQVAKISDFGLSAMLLNGATHRSTASLGTLTHMAPELLRDGRMSPSCDVYSFGILMWEVFTGQQAWRGCHYGVVIEKVVVQQERPLAPPTMPEEYALLMRFCFDADPTKRPSFEQVVVCLELMLDNLGSEDVEAAADADRLSRGAHPTSASGSHTALSNTTAAAAPAPAPVPANDQGLQQPQQQLLLRQLQQHDAQQAAAAAVARLPATLSGGSQPPSTPVQASQPQLGPQVHILHSSGGVGASPIGSYPSTADAHAWQLSSSSSSQHHHSSQLVAPAGPADAAALAAPEAPAPAGAAAASLSSSGASGAPLFKAVSSLDDRVYLQDL